MASNRESRRRLAMMALSSTVSLTGCGAWRYGSGPLQVVPQEYAAHTATYRINDLPDGGLRVSVVRWSYAEMPAERCRDLVVRLAHDLASQRNMRQPPDLSSLRANAFGTIISRDCSATIVVPGG